MSNFVNVLPGQFLIGTEDYDSFYNSNSGANSTLLAGAGSDSLSNDGPNTLLDGGDGDDYFSNYGTNSTIDGGAGNDYISNNPFGTSNSIAGGAGNDYINNFGSNSIVDGGDGNDTIWSFGVDTTVYGGNGNDFIGAYNNNTVVIGGAGDDVLTHGVAGTRFVFAVNATETQSTITTVQTQTFAQWLAPLNLSLDLLTQSQFSTQYLAWVKSMVATHAGVGTDVNGDGGIAVSLNQNDPTGLPTIEGMTAEQVGSYFNDSSAISIQTGKTTQDRFLAKQFTTSTSETVTTLTVSSPDGHDIIRNFEAGRETLVLQLPADLTLAQVRDMLAVSVIDADGDGAANDTLINFAHAPNDWSITLIGVTNFTLDSVVAG